MARLLTLFLLLSTSAWCGVIRGVVLENSTGLPLGRASLRLTAVGGGAVRAVRADRRGSFAFSGLAAGTYVLHVERRGFIPYEYGQKRWNSAASNITVEADGDAFLECRMLRYSAIGGMVVDENGVGAMSVPVAAYRRTEPPTIAARATTDARGRYRLEGLTPGRYSVRSLAYLDEEVPFWPTFSRETGELSEAYTYDLGPEQELERVDVRPMEGRLYQLTVTAPPPIPNLAVRLSISNSMGRQVASGPVYVFENLPPGDYEVTAEADGRFGAIQRISLGSNRQVSLSLQPAGGNLQLGGAVSFTSGELWRRRKDLAGVFDLERVQLKSNIPFPPGRWDVMLIPPEGYYPQSYSTITRGAAAPPQGWNEFNTFSSSAARFSLAGGPASVTGVVRQGSAISPGAPVYLEAYNATTQARIGELYSTRAGLKGEFRFTGLGPGSYRLLSTYEYREPESDVFTQAGAETVQLSEHGTAQKNLALWSLP